MNLTPVDLSHKLVLIKPTRILLHGLHLRTATLQKQPEHLSKTELQISTFPALDSFGQETELPPQPNLLIYNAAPGDHR